MENGNPELKYINAAFAGKQTGGSYLKRLNAKSLWAERKFLKLLLKYCLVTPLFFFLKIFTS